MVSYILNPYYLNIIILLLIAMILFKDVVNNQKKKWFVIIATLNWILISGLRHITIGADTLSYKSKFEHIKIVTWDKLLMNFKDILFYGKEGKDPGFEIFIKLTQYITLNYQVFLVLVAIIFTVPLGIWIYKNSSNVFISFLIYSSLFYSFFSITGIRQTIATAIVVLIGYSFVKKRKLIPFVLLIVIGFLIHKSALVFLPFYFLANKKITRNYLLSILAIFPVLMVFKEDLLTFLGGISGYEYGVYAGAGTRNFTIFLILVFIISIWKYKAVIINNPQSIHYYNALVLALLATPLTWVNPSAMRVVQYFSIFLILLLPQLLNSFKKEEKPLAYLITIGVLLILLLNNNPQFLFFWQ